MKILIIEQHDKERSVIREAIQAGRHDAVWAQNADEAWELVNAGEIRIVIADAETSDVTASKLIRRGPGLHIPPGYFFRLTCRGERRPWAHRSLPTPVSPKELPQPIITGPLMLR